MTQEQLIKTPKTMLDWFAENKVQVVGMDIPFDREISIMGGHAKIELDEATGRGKHSYYFWNDEGVGMEIEYGELNSAEAVALAKIVQALEDLLAKPYPTAKGTCVCTAACGAGLGHNKPS